ncbi:MAG TPA: AI-2E family transporter [Candidatus Dormibacteraeota bacterium]|nr:AI-2E family transporter [Candidatus Dormibacteraeota bacterium]
MAELLAAVRRHRLGLFVLAVGVLVAWLLWTARGALPAFFIALALAFLLDPIVTLLQRRGVPRWAGVLISYAGVVALGWALIAFAIPPIARQTRDFITHLPELGASLSGIQNDLLEWYRSLPLPAELREMLDESIRNAESAFAEAVRAILGPAVSAVLRIAAFILGLIVIPVWLFFVLKDRERFQPAMTGALPERWRDDGSNILTILARVGGRWVRGQLLLGVAVFAATVIGLTILTFIGFSEFGEFTLVLALIAGVLEFLPIIGPIVAAIPAILIGLSISPAAAIAAIVLYVGIQQLENNLLVPKVLGDAVDLHPAVLIVALIVGGALFGIGGAILAAPTVAAGRDLYRYTFQRLHDQSPSTALELALHGGKRAEPEPPPAPIEPAAPAPPEAERAAK